MLHAHLIALAVAAPAPWSEPVSPGTPALEVGSPAIAFARDGTALLSTNANSRPGGAFTGRLVIGAPNGAVTESRLPDQLAADPWSTAVVRSRCCVSGDRRVPAAGRG